MFNLPTVDELLFDEVILPHLSGPVTIVADRPKDTFLVVIPLVEPIVIGSVTCERCVAIEASAYTPGMSIEEVQMEIVLDRVRHNYWQFMQRVYNHIPKEAGQYLSRGIVANLLNA